MFYIKIVKYIWNHYTHRNFSLFSIATNAKAQPVKKIKLMMSKTKEFRSAFFPLAVTFPKNPKMGGIPRLWKLILLDLEEKILF